MFKVDSGPEVKEGLQTNQGLLDVEPFTENI